MVIYRWFKLFKNNHSKTSWKIPKFPPKIIQQHPVNPQILEILILTNKITNSPPKIIQQHPVNPQILDILILTKKSPTPTKNYPTTSCKSSNPGHRSDII